MRAGGFSGASLLRAGAELGRSGLPMPVFVTLRPQRPGPILARAPPLAHAGGEPGKGVIVPQGGVGEL